ncbi:unnamed protein product [Amoebophrya sp. A120]|nr:unnamed protein product [Amoebophrya sp. A120]|eukprot:GSA120T00012558001.1
MYNAEMQISSVKLKSSENHSRSCCSVRFKVSFLLGLNKGANRAASIGMTKFIFYHE